MVQDFATKRKVAVVAIHGIGPAQRYGIQDEVASHFKSALQVASKRRWDCDVFFPTVNQQTGAAQAYASALRVYQTGDNKEHPAQTAFDIYEGYWSPIDKNRTGVWSVLSWILKSTFIPLSTNARLPAEGAKLRFDLLYTTLAIVVLLLIGGLALGSAFFTYAWLTQSSATHAQVKFAEVIGDIIGKPGALFAGFRLWTLGALGLSLVGGYLLAQFIVSIRALCAPGSKPVSAFAQQEEARFTRWRVTTRAILLIVGLALLTLGCWMPTYGRLPFWMHFVPLGFLISALSFRAYLSMANDAFVNRVGDVQIYTTRDNNSQFYGLREQIVETVQRTVAQVLDTGDDQLPKDSSGRYPAAYERIYILGHSLGSTVAMDVLIRLHELVEGDTLDESDWRRIRGLITFGTSLEKTKFFYDLQNPSLSQSYQQWRGDVDGHLFTPNPKVLQGPTPGKSEPPLGIFWANYWYFHDIVANELITYRSAIPAGKPIANSMRQKDETLVAVNIKLKDNYPARLWVHSDYVADANFWTGSDDQIGVLEILTS